MGNETLALSLGSFDRMFENRVRIPCFKINLQFSSSYKGKINKNDDKRSK
jgi:hypothetical protein